MKKQPIISRYEANNVAEVTIAYKNTVMPSQRHQIKSSKDCYDLMYAIFDPNTIEHSEYFYAMYLNKQNKVLAIVEISHGSIEGTVVDVRIILQYACLLNASAIMLCHNHPSGRTVPSESDIKLTKKIKECCLLHEMSLLDHIILCPEKSLYYSFCDDGKM